MGLVFLRRFLRSIVPLNVRRRVSSLKRTRQDKQEAYDFASDVCSEIPFYWTKVASLTQPLIVAPQLEEKRANLAKAIGLMNGLIIKPNQTLSVWHCLGPPTAQRGWASGRTIINDVMTTDPGGGLCQFSSLIYHLGLLAGLKVVERHHHSRDIHVTDATRFTPLGLDATIVHGFKDLRLANDSTFDLVLTFELSDLTLSGEIWSTQPIVTRNIHIERHDGLGSRGVVVSYVDETGSMDVISRDLYLL